MKYLRLFRNENDYNQYIDGNTDDYITPNICVLIGNKRPHYTKYFDVLSEINGILENIISETDEPLDINILNQIQSSNQDFTDINNQLEEIISGKELISFTIEGTQYYAIDGMTWGDWVNSEYNTDGYRIVSFGPFEPAEVLLPSGNGNVVNEQFTVSNIAYADDTIINKWNYYHM